MKEKTEKEARKKAWENRNRKLVFDFGADGRNGMVGR